MTTYKPKFADDVWEAENSFYLASHPSRIGKALAHYEIYKEIVNLPGAVVECGVFKGASLVRLATFRHLLENDDARHLIGFDAFGKFPSENLQLQADQAFVERYEEQAGHGISPDDLKSLMTRKGFSNIELIEGDVLSTVTSYVSANEQLRIALLHLDMDVYEPTRHCLQMLHSRMVPGGIIMFDDYGAVAGATQAIDEFVRAHDLDLEKAEFYYTPAFVRC
jgi:hypothetical protein